MHSIEETELAGIGIKYAFETDARNKLILVVHDSGIVELYYEPPSESKEAVPIATLKEDEARVVAAIISRTIYRPQAFERLLKHGVEVTWCQIKAGAYGAGKTLSELLQNTGVSALALLDKDGKKQTSPPSSYALQEGDQIAIAGGQKEIQSFRDLLEKGPQK